MSMPTPYPPCSIYLGEVSEGSGQDTWQTTWIHSTLGSQRRSVRQISFAQTQFILNLVNTDPCIYLNEIQVAFSRCTTNSCPLLQSGGRSEMLGCH